MIQKLNGQEIEELLSKNVVGHIGCHANGLTYVVPISYAYDGQFIYCHTKEGLKVGLMRKNPSVCFQVDELKDIANWKSVIVQGTFEELKDEASRAAGLKKLVDRILPIVTSQTMHLSPEFPFVPDHVNSIKGLVFRISPHEKTGRFETTSVSVAYC
jgi:uncharacterized protein